MREMQNWFRPQNGSKCQNHWMALMIFNFASSLKLANTETITNNCTEEICFPESYNRFIPPEERLPIYIFTPLDVGEIAITEVDDYKFSLTLNIALSLCWQDNRVIINGNSSFYKKLDPYTAKKLWKSGLYIPNLKKNKKVLHDDDKLGIDWVQHSTKFCSKSTG